MAKLLAILSLLLALAPNALHADEAGARPNVLFIAVDDLKPLTGWYGSETVNTPTLDRLAVAGLRFTQFYSAGRCVPTRASLMNGL